MADAAPAAQPAKRRGLSWDDPQVVSFIAGSLAGALTATFVCPLDVLKTRQQLQSKAASFDPRYSGISGSLTKIFNEEGVRGLYRGLTPTLVALLPNWAVYFTVYDRLKESIAANAQESRWVRGPVLHMLSASGAGLATMCVTNPLWVIKTRLQTQHMGLQAKRANGLGVAPLYRGTADAFLRISREEGIGGLYSGLIPSIVGVAHVAIQFPLYEALKAYMLGEEQAGSNTQLSPLQLMAASACSKVVASTATYPHEVIRSHMHIRGIASFSGFTQTCRNVLEQDGVRGFYRGCTTNLVRTTPAAALTFTSYELIARRMRALAPHQPVAASVSGDSGSDGPSSPQEAAAPPLHVLK